MSSKKIMQCVLIIIIRPLRYLSSIPSLADKYYPNNVLIVTHQYGVEQAATLALGDSRSYEVT